jgi:signal transduction histidine kinase
LIKDVKFLSTRLGNRNFKEGDLVAALENEAGMIARTGLFEVEFESEQNIYSIDPEKEIIVYRMCQEIFNNIIKHSKASKIKVSIYPHEDSVIFNISDNGQGFKPSDKRGAGAGLNNLRERSRLIGAEVSITSQDQKGTSVIINVPVK